MAPGSRAASAAILAVMATPSVYRFWIRGWLGLLLLAMLNGTVRATVLAPRWGEETARRIATLVLLVALTAYVSWWNRRHPIPSDHQAWMVGLAWVVMTVGFEFGFGRVVAGLSWSAMVADYDVTAGRTWVLVPLWTAIAPEVVRRLQSRADHVLVDPPGRRDR